MPVAGHMCCVWTPSTPPRMRWAAFAVPPSSFCGTLVEAIRFSAVPASWGTCGRDPVFHPSDGDCELAWDAHGHCELAWDARGRNPLIHFPVLDPGDGDGCGSIRRGRPGVTKTTSQHFWLKATFVRPLILQHL